MRAAYSCAIAILVFAASAGAAASAAPPQAVQINVPYRDAPACPIDDVSIDSLSRAYFGQGAEPLQKQVATLLQRCLGDAAPSPSPTKQEKQDAYTILLFLATPTPHATQPTVAHVVYNPYWPMGRGVTVLPGIKRARFVYVTEVTHDEIVTQLASTPADNPVYAQLGQMFAALEKPLEGVPMRAGVGRAGLAAAGAPQPGRPPHRLFIRVAECVSLEFDRGSLVETDLLYVPKMNEDGSFVCRKDDKQTTPDVDKAAFQQLTGTFTLNNVPLTCLTVDAGVAVLTGPVAFHQKMKVEDGVYASDPLSYGAALAGVTFHAPFDSTSARPGWRQVVGLFVGGVAGPSAGFGVGGSFGWKGIALNAGYALLLVPTAPDGAKPGAPASTDSNQKSQLVTRVAGSPYIGVSYAFK
jgi:hypothetical protein